MFGQKGLSTNAARSKDQGEQLDCNMLLLYTCALAGKEYQGYIFDRCLAGELLR